MTSERVKNASFLANILHTATTGTDATIYFFIFRPFSPTNKDSFISGVRPFLNELNSKCCYYTGTNIFCEAINEIEAGIGQKKLT